MINNIFSSLDLYKKGLQAMTLRSEVIANNVANSQTPGYKAKDLDFDKIFKDYVRRKNNLSDHASFIRDVRFAVTKRPNMNARSVGNNVDIEQEMIEAAKNNMTYDLVTKALNSRLYMIKSAIKEGRR